MKNETRKTMLYIVLCVMFIFTFNSCKTLPIALDTSNTDTHAVDVMQTQTDITGSAKELESTIGNIKDITDTAKTTGELSKEKIVKVIEYVDKSSSQVKVLNETIAKQTEQIATLEKSRIEDNSSASKLVSNKQNQIDKEKIKASIFFRWALIATVIALVLAVVLWLPKLLKLIM